MMKDKFFALYQSLPEEERMNVIYLDEKHGPISWHVVWLELKGDTPLGSKILIALEKSGII